jgi:hypothetical protein
MHPSQHNQLIKWDINEKSYAYKDYRIALTSRFGTLYEYLAGSLEGKIDTRLVAWSDFLGDTWFAPPGSIMYGIRHAGPILVRNVHQLEAAYDEAMIQNAMNNAPAIVLTFADLGRQRLAPRRVLGVNQDVHHSQFSPDKVQSQFNQAMMLFEGSISDSTHARLRQESGYLTARDNKDMVRFLYELDLVGTKGNADANQMMRHYEDNCFRPDEMKCDMSTFGSNMSALSLYNEQFDRNFKSAKSLNSQRPEIEFVTGYIKGLCSGFNSMKVHFRNTCKSLPEAYNAAIEHVKGENVLGIGNWSLPSVSTSVSLGDKRARENNNAPPSTQSNKPPFRVTSRFSSSNSDPSRSGTSFTFNNADPSRTASGGGGGASGGGVNSKVPSIPVFLVTGHDGEDYEIDPTEHGFMHASDIQTLVQQQIEVFHTNLSAGGDKTVCMEWARYGTCSRNESNNSSVACRFAHPPNSIPTSKRK